MKMFAFAICFVFIASIATAGDSVKVVVSECPGGVCPIANHSTHSRVVTKHSVSSGTLTRRVKRTERRSNNYGKSVSVHVRH